MAFPTNPSPGDSYTDEYGTVWVYAGTVNGWYRQTVTTPNDTSYTAAISGPAGSNTQVQFNDNGELAGDSGLTYNKTTDALSGGAFIPTGSAVPSSGLYRPSANNVALSTNGVQRINIEADGDINIDSGGVFYEASTNRLAIGTTSPSALLDIEGTGASNHFEATSTGNCVVRLTASNTSGCYLQMGDPDDTNRGIILYDNSSDSMSFTVNAQERARIDSSGRLLVGTSSAQAVGTATSGLNQLQGTSAAAYFSVSRHSTDAFPPAIALGKSRSATTGGTTIVVSGDELGAIRFCGADGSDLETQGASISAFVDGTPGANDMPGRLEFSTTADGAASPTEQLRITSDRYVRLASGTGGIQFNGDTAAANALDDYEEGTWTVSLFDAFSGGNASSTTTTGSYTKIGHRVFAYFNISNINTSGMTAGNRLTFTLPFQAGSTASLGTCSADNLNVNAGYTTVLAYVGATATRGYFDASGDALGLSNVLVSMLTSGTTDIGVYISYTV